MSSTIAVIKFLVWLQQFAEGLLDEILARANEADRAKLGEAIRAARLAKTDAEKRDAARRIQESFRRTARGDPGSDSPDRSPDDD